MTPSGIAPATCRRLAQYFNQMRHRVFPLYKKNKLRDYNNSNMCRCSGLNLKKTGQILRNLKARCAIGGFS
jgi:hypothetical protein